MPGTFKAALDVGCGTGVTTRELAARGYEAIGVDVSLRALEVARGAGGTYLYADAADLPFEDGAFDLVVALNVLMEVADMPGAVREAARVLKPGGEYAVRLMDRPRSPFHGWDDYEPAIVAAGFTIEERREQPGLLSIRSRR